MAEKLGYELESLDNWRGRWISTGHPHYYWNEFLRFRKTFKILKKQISSSITRISGDTRYILWVNGKYVCRGPAKGYPSVQPYDTIDIKDFLKPDKNVIAVLLHVFGVSTFSNVWRGRAGIVVDGEIVFCDGGSIRIDTDSSWLAIVDSARSSEGQRLSVQQSFQEIFFKSLFF